MSKKKKILIDTCIIIDFLKGSKEFKSIFLDERFELFYSVITRKELFRKKGLSNTEIKKILKLFSTMDEIQLDQSILDIAKKNEKQYLKRNDDYYDLLIASSSISKKLPLLTKNKKHFEFLDGVELVMV